MKNIFERASKQKLRFNTGRGLLSVEDIWGLSLTSLDNLAKSVNKQVKETSEESFISVKTTINTEAVLKLDILKHIIAYKLDLKSKGEVRAAKAAKITTIKGLMEANQVKELSEKSSDDLAKMLKELEEE